ncbi:hypothetical protein ColTof3_06697 [Colletotrichum tofieldiae]|nr:hypothetical protein ColTof3_06697 [Colletotrichum tofieldiae]
MEFWTLSIKASQSIVSLAVALETGESIGKNSLSANGNRQWSAAFEGDSFPTLRIARAVELRGNKETEQMLLWLLLLLLLLSPPPSLYRRNKPSAFDDGTKGSQVMSGWDDGVGCDAVEAATVWDAVATFASHMRGVRCCTKLDGDGQGGYLSSRDCELPSSPIQTACLAGGDGKFHSLQRAYLSCGILYYE